MGEITGISWCDHSWSPWIGCTKVSPACDGCYAAHLMDTRLGRVEWGPHGERRRTSADYWRQPLRWNKAAAKAGRRETVFPSLCDPFDNQAAPELRAEAFALMRSYESLVWLLLTKRPQNIIKMAEAAGGLPPNAAIGATCEDQKRADINVPHLLEAKAALRPAFAFLSCEPLLGPISLEEDWVSGESFGHADDCHDDLCALNGDMHSCSGQVFERPCLDWIITGGETDQGKHKGRPTNPQWFRDIRDQCAYAGIPFHHKQNGEWVSVSEVEGFVGNEIHEFPDGRCVRRIGKHRTGRTIDGVEHDGRPAPSPSASLRGVL